MRSCLVAVLGLAAHPAGAATVDGSADVRTLLDLPNGVVLVESVLGDPVVSDLAASPDATVAAEVTGDAFDFTLDFLLTVAENAARGADAPSLSASVESATVTAAATLRNDNAFAVEVPFTQTGGYSIRAEGDRFPEGEAFDPFRDLAGISASLVTATGFEDGRTAFDFGDEETGGFDATGQSIDPFNDGTLLLEPGEVLAFELATARFTNATVIDAPAPIPLPAGGLLLLAGLGSLRAGRILRRGA